jgi:hypothetical protein
LREGKQYPETAATKSHLNGHSKLSISHRRLSETVSVWRCLNGRLIVLLKELSRFIDQNTKHARRAYSGAALRRIS